MHFLVCLNLRKIPTLSAIHRRLQKQLYIKKKKSVQLMFIHHNKWYYSLEKLLPMPEIFISVLSESSMKRRRKWENRGLAYRVST